MTSRIQINNLVCNKNMPSIEAIRYIKGCKSFMYVQVRNVMYHHLHSSHRVTCSKSCIVVNYYRTSNIYKEIRLTIVSLLQRNIFNSISDHKIIEISIYYIITSQYKHHLIEISFLYKYNNFLTV